jgi:argonaute-like protein implicated in RNA metabolism and viral defense
LCRDSCTVLIITHFQLLNTENVLNCFKEYMAREGKKPTHSLYVSNMEEKMANDEFTGDTASLLRPDEKYNPNEAYEIVKAQIIDKLIVPEKNGQ